MGVSCKISLYPQSDGKYDHQPGSKVAGVIKYHLNKEYKFTAIVVSLKGQGMIYFEDNRLKLYDRVRSYTNKETYLDVDSDILINIRIKHYPAGEYETPFSFQLPHDIPASLNYTKSTSSNYCRCFIDYYVSVTFERLGLWKISKHFQKEISIVSGQTPRMATTPLMYSDQTSLLQLSSLFSRHMSIVSLNATIANSVLRPGESVKIDCEVQNNTGVDIKRVEVILLEVDRYTSNGGRKLSVKSEVQYTKFTYGSINRKEKATFTAEIIVPSLCASLENSVIFGRDYVVLTTVVLPMPHINLDLEIPLQVIDRMAINFEERTDAVAGCASDAPPSYWEVMSEDKNYMHNNEAGHRFG